MEKVLEISKYELERGKPMPSKLHSIAQANLMVILANYREKYRFFSELSLSLPDWDTVPDACIYAKNSLDLFEDEITVKVPPLCAIEILSPSQSLNELIEKVKKYFERGVKSCWVVIPIMKNVYVFSDLQNYEVFKSGMILQDNVLGISFPVSEIFV
jgi:Uma2 family endonuclease